MDMRFRALLRQARPHASADLLASAVAEPLIQTLCSNIRSKHQYHDTMLSGKSVTAFAVKHGLTAEQERLLILMQRHKDVFNPSDILDHALTVIFFMEVGLMSWYLAGQGMLLTFVACVMVTATAIFCVKRVARATGVSMSNWLYVRGITATDTLSGPIQLKKWTDQSWQLFLHFTFACAEWYILSEEPWLEQTATPWLPHPDKQIGSHRPELLLIYLCQLAGWMYTCVIHRVFDERRKDYFVMYAHHVVTIGLIALSWAAGYLRIGLAVLWVHDASDVMVDLLKMANYLKLEGPKAYFTSECTYALCVTSWAYWRLFLFPSKILQSATFDAYKVLAPPPRADDGLFGLFPSEAPAAGWCVALLYALFCMNTYWFFLLGRVGYRALTESAREASRQEYEGDSDDDLDDVPSVAAEAVLDAASLPSHAWRQRK